MLLKHSILSNVKHILSLSTFFQLPVFLFFLCSEDHLRTIKNKRLKIYTMSLTFYEMSIYGKHHD